MLKPSLPIEEGISDRSVKVGAHASLTMIGRYGFLIIYHEVGVNQITPQRKAADIYLPRFSAMNLSRSPAMNLSSFLAIPLFSDEFIPLLSDEFISLPSDAAFQRRIHPTSQR